MSKKKTPEPRGPQFSDDPHVAALELVDAAYDRIELYDPKDSPYNRVWKENWLKKARELGASPGW